MRGGKPAVPGPPEPDPRERREAAGRGNGEVLGRARASPLPSPRGVPNHHLQENNMRTYVAGTVCAVFLGVARLSLPEAAQADHVSRPPSLGNSRAGGEQGLPRRSRRRNTELRRPPCVGFADILWASGHLEQRQRSGKSSSTSSSPTDEAARPGQWQHSKDTSTIWAVAIASSSDPKFVAPGAIPWLLLRVVGIRPDPPAAISYSRPPNPAAEHLGMGGALHRL